MGEEKYRGHNQAYMKQEGHDGHHWMSSHIHRGEWCDPVDNGAETVSQAHIRKDKFFFLIDLKEHRQKPIEAATDK